jgi:hypothetical protein
MHVSRSAFLGAVAAAGLLSGCGATSDAGRTGSAPPAAGPGGARTQLVTVPQLIGRRQEDAHRIAGRLGLRLRWTGFAGKLANGRYDVSCVKVSSQSPVAGERRPRGAQIAVIETACKVPDERPHGV